MKMIKVSDEAVMKAFEAVDNLKEERLKKEKIDESLKSVVVKKKSWLTKFLNIFIFNINQPW